MLNVLIGILLHDAVSLDLLEKCFDDDETWCPAVLSGATNADATCREGSGIRDLLSNNSIRVLIG